MANTCRYTYCPATCGRAYIRMSPLARLRRWLLRQLGDAPQLTYYHGYDQPVEPSWWTVR